MALALAVMLASGCGSVKNRSEIDNALYWADNSDNYYNDDDDFLDFMSDGSSSHHIKPAVSDPLHGWNRAMFTFNDKMYYWVLKPVASGYTQVVPKFARIGIKNFFYNLAAPGRFANCVLQGKGEKAIHELGGFLVNSTLGVLGFGNPAKNHFKMAPSAEDFGQTLAVYGIGDGLYIVWPILGPSTLRDSVGLGVQSFTMDPLIVLDIPWEASATVLAVEKINDVSFVVGDYETLKSAAIDPYEALRDIYLQYRKRLIQD